MSNTRKPVLIGIIGATIAISVVIGAVSADEIQNLIGETGFVGIGTLTPTAELEVVGDIKLSGSLISDNDICIGNCENAFLTAHYEFEEDTTDSGPLQNHGTVVPLTGEQYATGQIGQAFDFDGSTYVTLANESDYDFERTDPFSIAFWMKGSNTGTFEQYVGKGVHHNPGYYIYSNIDDHIEFQIYNNVSDGVFARYSPNLRDGTWHHVVWTYDGSSSISGVKVYVDGVAGTVTTVFDSLTQSTLNNHAVAIGASYKGDGKFTGQIDDVRIYNKELTVSEVQDIYNGVS